MTAAECAEEYIRIVTERTDPALRHSEWDKQSEWVRETITKLAQQVAGTERKACGEIVKSVSDRDYKDDCSRIGEALRIAVARIEARGEDVEEIKWESSADKIEFHFGGSEKI